MIGSHCTRAALFGLSFATGVAVLVSINVSKSASAQAQGPGNGPPAGAGPVAIQTASVNWHAQQQLVDFGGNGMSGPVDDAWAMLVRTPNGITYLVHANGLNPGHAYSLWLVVVNNPDACSSTPCTAPDILGDPATESQVLSGGTGVVAGSSGRATLAGSAQVGPLEGWLPDGFLGDPSTVEVHLVINDHGPMLPAFMPGMITTYRAGCSDDSPFPPVFPDTALADGEVGPNICLLHQSAVFTAP